MFRCISNTEKNFLLLNLFYLLVWRTTSADIFDWIADKYGDSIPQLNSTADKEILKEAMLDPVEISKKLGYAAEHHNVTTRDGYILALHRIPRGKRAGNGENVILLMHGNAVTSNSWVEIEERSMPFFLADNGFDVWMGNFRGNYYTSHQNYSRRQKIFWDFTFSQMADYDVPAMVDYILNITSKSKLVYCGHSMGTTVGFALLSAHKEYHDKIAGFIAMAPATVTNYAPTIFRLSSGKARVLNKIPRLFGIYHAPSLQPKLFKLEQHLCPASDTLVCGLMIDLVVGYDPYLRNNSKNFIYIAHVSIGGMSQGIIEHYAQIYYKNDMYRYDYGWTKNLIKYGSYSPPKFDFRKIKRPVAIMYGANDCFSNPLDNCLLKRKIPNLIGYKLVDYPMFNHADFHYALNGEELFYNDFLNFAKKMIE